jgi:hypothetical protein
VGGIAVTAAAFATAASAQSAAPIDLAVSPDGKAFTATYSDFGVQVNETTGDGRLATRWEWFVLPLTDDGGQGEPVTVTVSGYALCQNGAKAAIVVSLNGVSRHVAFDAEQEVVETVEYLTTGFDTEIRLAIGLLADGNTDATAMINVSAVDGSLPLPGAPASRGRRRPAGRSPNRPSTPRTAP